MKIKNHPGVYVPPPIIYVIFFFSSLFMQRVWPLDSATLKSTYGEFSGWILIALFFIINLLAIKQFIASKNTVVTVRPATSLQTTGIYRFTRNPMYLGLLLLYCGFAFFKGNWWTFILLPVLIAVIQYYVIRREEAYLHNAFGADYDHYKQRVRRWI